jgi:hypothetical protein
MAVPGNASMLNYYDPFLKLTCTKYGKYGNTTRLIY